MRSMLIQAWTCMPMEFETSIFWFLKVIFKAHYFAMPVHYAELISRMYFVMRYLTVCIVVQFIEG